MFVCIIGAVYIIIVAMICSGAAWAFHSSGVLFDRFAAFLGVSQIAGLVVLGAVAAALFVVVSVPGFALIALGRSQTLLKRIHQRQDEIISEIREIKPYLD